MTKDRNRVGGVVGAIPVRGGGAYFSFAAQSNDYDDDPNVDLRHGRFGSGFAGGDEGWINDLGVLDGESLRSAITGECPGVG